MSIFEPFSDLEVVQTDGFDFDLAFLIGCQVLRTILLQTQFVERLLIAAIQLLIEEFLEVGISLLLLSDHLSGPLVLLLLFKKLDHCQRLFTFLCTSVFLLVCFRLTARVEFLVDDLLFALLLSRCVIQNSLFEWYDWLTNLKFYSRSEICLQIFEALFKVHLATSRKDVLSLLVYEEFDTGVSTRHLLEALDELGGLHEHLRLNCDLDQAFRKPV